MTILFDTNDFPRRDRADALQAAFRGESPQRVVFADQQHCGRRIDVVDFGPDVRLLRNVGASVQITRDAKHVRMDAPEYTAIGFQRSGANILSIGGLDTQTSAGHLSCVDITRPYSYLERGLGAHDSLIVSNRQLNVSVDLVRAAAPTLKLSPLYDLVRSYAARLFEATRDLDEKPRLLAGQATVTLVRALLGTAAQGRTGLDAMDEALDLRITLYIDAHLGDHDLVAEQIAGAHHISLRHLYSAWTQAGHDRPIMAWILHRRLQQARERLTDDSRSSIEKIAHDCGFRNASHFGRRFRESFGVSPGHCRTDGTFSTTSGPTQSGVSR